MLTLLIDLSLSWGNTQEHLLALAHSLHQEGRFQLRLCCPRHSPLAQKARDLHLPLLPLQGCGPWNALSLFRLWRLVSKERHCLIHTFSGAAPRLGATLVKMRQQGRTVLIHTCKNAESLAALEPPLHLDSRDQLPLYWREAQKVVCGNNYMHNLLTHAGIDPGRLVRIPAGIDIHALPPRQSLPEKRFIFVGMAPRGDTAGYSLLIKAMAALWQNDTLPPWEMRLVGRGMNFQSIMDEAISLGIESRLAILGEQKLGDVLPLAHALVAAGTRPTGSLHAIAAAWVTGLPLLCPDLPVNQEWVSKETALIYKPEDPQGLAAHMKFLMRDPALYQKLVDAEQRCIPQVSLHRATEQCRQMYISCLEKNGWVLPLAPAVEAEPSTPEHAAPQDASQFETQAQN